MSDPFPPAPTRWWIEAEGRVWGPYSGERLAGFRTEGRLGADSRVAARAEGPFESARTQAELAPLFAAPAPGPLTFQPVPPEPKREPEVGATGKADAATAAEAAAAPGLRPLLVVCDAGEDARAAVEAALGGRGGVVRMRQGLWLVRARESAPTLRNALSRALGGADALLVVDAPLSGAAWFNLGGETDRALRRLWSDVGADTERT